jgi:diacylglycerol kinase (ATP)
MIYAFIVNPASGNGRKASKLIDAIDELKARSDKDIRCYVTGGELDAMLLADKLAEEAAKDGEEVSIFACGGDGTINEVCNGIMGHENACLGVVPVGSGNDFVRCFDDPKAFLDLNKQLRAKRMKIDVLKITYYDGENKVGRYVINGINIGFDGNSAILSGKLREKPLINGPMSYLMAVGANLIKKNGQTLEVTADDLLLHKGRLLMCTAANGRFCGGGVESCPNALLDNGKIELLVVKDITRRKFVSAFPKFKNGRLDEVKDVNKIAKNVQAERVIIRPIEGRMQYVVDGESMETGDIRIEVKTKALDVLVP